MCTIHLGIGQHHRGFAVGQLLIKGGHFVARAVDHIGMALAPFLELDTRKHARFTRLVRAQAVFVEASAPRAHDHVIGLLMKPAAHRIHTWWRRSACSATFRSVSAIEVSVGPAVSSAPEHRFAGLAAHRANTPRRRAPDDLILPIFCDMVAAAFENSVGPSIHPSRRTLWNAPNCVPIRPPCIAAGRKVTSLT
jgi:hypothetical protein